MDNSGQAEPVDVFEMRRPLHCKVPLVLASPHSGADYPDEFLAASRLDPLTLRRSEDSFVDEIFAAAPDLGAPLVAVVAGLMVAVPAARLTGLPLALLTLAFALSRVSEGPITPTPIGVFRDVERPTYEGEVQRQLAAAQDRSGPGDLRKLIESGSTWEVN